MDFSAEASKWDTDKRVKRAKIIAEQIKRAIDIKEHFNALEFGCGTGLISFNLHDKFESITLVDTAKGMIDVLNEKIQDSGINNMKALQRDIDSHNELSGNYDVIYTSMVLHHIKDTETTLKNLHTLLKNNGQLCIVELSKDDGTFHKYEQDFDGHNGFEQAELKDLLEKIGFRKVTYEVFFRDVKVIDCTEFKYSLFLMKAEKSDE